MKNFLILALFAGLVGCAGVSHWEPVLNSKVDKNTSTASVDVAECRVLADQAAGWLVEGAEGTLVAAAGGAAEGAVIGALVGGGAVHTQHHRLAHSRIYSHRLAHQLA